MTINLDVIPSEWKPRATQYMDELVRAFTEEGIAQPVILAYACASICHESSWNPSAEITDICFGDTTFMAKGFAQVILESNYKKITEHTGIDFLSNPQLMFDPYCSLRAKAAHFVIHRMIPYIERRDFESAAGIYNGGRPNYRSTYTENIASDTPKWLPVFETSSFINDDVTTVPVLNDSSENNTIPPVPVLND